MNKQEAYKLARHAAEFYENDDDLVHFLTEDFRDFLCWAYVNGYEIVKKNENTIEPTEKHPVG